jgi:hypothetical protein
VPGKSLDVLILFLLVLARIWSDTLADTVLPQRQADVQQLVSNWWPAASLERLAHPQTDPVSMMLIVASIGLLIVYLLLDQIETAPATSEVGNPPKPGRAGDSGATSSRAQTVHRLKLIVIYGIIALLVFGKTALLIGLRHQRGPASYTHDGGVIQTEATIDYFLAGLNPYAEDYVNTPLAEWGFSEYRTALYHYPYLPWTFIFSTPFYLLSTAWLGWFDQRLVYLVLFALSLALAQTMVRRPRDRRLAVAIIGLNPIMASDVIFGQNDSFVLFWILLGLWLVRRPGERYPALLGSAAFGLACASKPTAWFLAPFWLLYLARDRWGESLVPSRARGRRLLATLVRRVWTLPLVFLVSTGPWFVWNPGAMIDDVWRWGASNLVLGLGWVKDRFEYWPFLLPELIVSLPLLWFLLRRQARRNTLSTMLSGYIVLLLAFFYVSRFLQPNYLGFMLAFLTLAHFVDE